MACTPFSHAYTLYSTRDTIGADTQRPTGHGRARVQRLTVRVEPRAGFVARGDARGHGPRKGKWILCSRLVTSCVDV